MIYLDSNIFLYSMVYDEEKVPKAKKSKYFLLKISSERIPASTCCRTWDEIVHIVKKISGSDAAEIAGQHFLDFPHLKILDVDRNTIEEAQYFMKQYNLQPRDSIHAATAVCNGIRDFLTDDSHFDRVRELDRISLDDWEKSRSM